MLIKFPPIFVADTKIIYGYNFVSPLITRKRSFISSKNVVRLLNKIVNVKMKQKFS